MNSAQIEAPVAHNVNGGVIDYVTTAIPPDGIDHVTATVFVVDDDVSMRESLEPLIRTAGWEPETFASAEEFLSHLPRFAVPSCVILDLRLPGLSGLELQKRLAARPDMPIIFITGHTDVPMTVQAMKAGAVEFLTKPVNDIVLLHAIRTAIERSRAALRDDLEMRTLAKRYSSLTPRERELMALVVSGLLNKQIAGELGISVVTVKAHRGQVMRKMEAASLPHLVTMAAQLELRHTRPACGPLPIRQVQAQPTHQAYSVDQHFTIGEISPVTEPSKPFGFSRLGWPRTCGLRARRGPMLKIQRKANGDVVLTVSGRLAADNASELAALLAAEPAGQRLVLDLKDVVLVDRDIVRYLRACEGQGIALRNCPPYIREWIAREEEQPREEDQP